MARAGRGRLDVVTIPSDNLTRALTNALDDPRAGVFQGACRVYPVGVDWETNPMAVPLRMGRNPAEISDLPQKILGDVVRELERAASLAEASSLGKSPASAAPRALISAAADPALQPLPVEVSSPNDAESLGRYLRSTSRSGPAVVVSRATGATTAWPDVARLRHDLAGLAEVFEIVGLDASWAFSRAVPDMCQVYGGASRVYPSGTGWALDPYQSPLRFAYGKTERESVTRMLIADAMGMASTGSLTVQAIRVARAWVVGEVEGIAGERALVRLAGQFPGVLWPELVEPGLPAERLFTRHMRVEGELDPDTRRIDVREMRRKPDEAVAGYRPGDTILVRVASVTGENCAVELFPGFECSIPAELVVDEPTDLRGLMTVGEVLPAWFGGLDEATGEWLLSVQDAADPAEAVAAPSILAGGPPWLLPAAPSPAGVPEVDEASAFVEIGDEEGETTAELSTAFVEALQRDNDQLVTLLKRSQTRIDSLEAALNATRTKLREAVRRKSRSGVAAPDDSRLFESDKDQLSFEINQAWARMTQPAEKGVRPLKRWSFSSDFFDTLREVEGVSRGKVVEVIVHVLTGMDAELASRERHQLRTGKGGDDPPVVRKGGEPCWRVSLQSNAPSARRLHYWSCSDGSIELSGIRVHDDFRP